MAKILIVEDNPQNMKLAVLLLEKAGHEVLQAMDAESGIDRARTQRPDLILMDVQLPGMDGLAAVRVLKCGDAPQQCRIYALTALAMKGDAEKILQAGFDGYIAKPLRYQDFMQAVDGALRLEGGIP